MSDSVQHHLEEETDVQSAMAAVRGAIAQFEDCTDEERAALVNEFRQLDEMAKKLDLSKDGVKGLLRRIRHALRKCMEKAVLPELKE